MENPASRFTVLDWIGTTLTAGAILALASLSFAAKAFQGMFRDLGATHLPALTRAVTQPWLPPLLALVATAVTSVAIRRAMPLSRRRLCVIAGFGLACVCIGLCLTGFYLPVFEDGSAVRGP